MPAGDNGVDTAQGETGEAFDLGGDGDLLRFHCWLDDRDLRATYWKQQHCLYDARSKSCGFVGIDLAGDGNRKSQKTKAQRMNLVLLKAIFKAKRNGLYRLVEADGPTRLDCLSEKCAKCCKCLGSPVVSVDEAENIDEGVIYKCQNGMFIKSDNSICTLLNEGLCSIYHHRPRGCREYPWYNIGGVLYYDSGCPGIKHDADERPDVEGIQLFSNFFPGASKFSLWFIKRLCLK